MFNLFSSCLYAVRLYKKCALYRKIQAMTFELALVTVQPFQEKNLPSILHI